MYCYIRASHDDVNLCDYRNSYIMATYDDASAARKTVNTLHNGYEWRIIWVFTLDIMAPDDNVKFTRNTRYIIIATAKVTVSRIVASRKIVKLNDYYDTVCTISTFVSIKQTK